MLTNDQINKILEVNDSYKQPAKLLSLMLDEKARVETFRKFFELETDMSFDWFQEAYEIEHAERKDKKQDFTPNSVGELLSRLVGKGEGTNLDVAAGTGGLTIQKWNLDMMKESPFTYKPSDHLYQCEELSDRALPFLLFNLLIRGMNATVLHGDTLTRNFKGVFFIQNEADDFLGYSSLNVVPDSSDLRELLMIKELKNIYPAHIESFEMPAHLTNK